VVKLQSWGFRFGMNDPDFAVCKVAQQGLEVSSRYLSCPDDLSMVDIRIVVDPFLMLIVFGRIFNNDQMMAGQIV